MAELGVRAPRHKFLVRGRPRLLQPAAAVPIRVGESIIGVSGLVDAIWSRTVVAATQATPVTEVAGWLVPMSALGPEFRELFSSDPDDFARSQDPNSRSGVSVNVADHGVSHNNSGTPLSMTNNPWCGEIALGNLETPGPADELGAFGRYPSAATWAVAEFNYELQFGTDLSHKWGAGHVARQRRFQATGVRNPNYYNASPMLAPLSRTMETSVFPMGTGMDDQPDPFDSIADLQEHISVLSKRDRSYVEYLEDNGIKREWLRGIPENVFRSRRRMMVRGSGTTDIEFLPAGTLVTDPGEVPDAGISFDDDNAAGIQHMNTIGVNGTPRAKHRINVRKRHFATEPSIFLITVATWPGNVGPEFGSGYLGVTHLVDGRLWGDRTTGLAEEDFLLTKRLFEQGGTRDYHDEQDSVLLDVVMNSLSLFLEGENYSNITGVAHMEYGQSVAGDAVVNFDADIGNDSFATYDGGFRVGVLSDLVAP